MAALDVQLLEPRAASAAPAQRQAAAPAGQSSTPLVAADVASAQLTARVRGKRVEVLSERGEESTTFANPDGSFTSENFMAPVRVRDKSGKDGWKDVDLTLVSAGDGSVEPAQHPRKVKLAGKAAGAALTRLEDRQGRQIEYRWLKKLPAPELAGNRATYRSVEPGVDLVQEVTRTSVEQFLILRSRAAALAAAAQAENGVYKLRIPIKLKGLTPNAREDGGIDFLDAKGVVQQTVPAPRAWDAELIEHADVPANEIQPAMTFESNGANKGDLVLDVDAAWLADPARQFPITIDPTTTLAAAHDTFVQNNISGAQAGSAELRVGTYDGSAKARSFMKFSTSAFRGSDVTSATLSLWNFHSWSCSARTVNIHSSATTDVNTTWANQPAAGTLRYAPSFAKGYSGCAAGWANVSVTGLAQLWADSTATTAGIRLSASESDVTGWKKFNSANASSNVPKLSVTYNRYPNTPGTTTHTPGTASATSTAGWATSATPTVKAVVSDPDGGSVKGLFSVYLNGTGNPIIDKAAGSTVTSGGTSQYVIPAGRLANGSRYLVRAYASDGTLTSKAYGGYDNFVVDNAAPAAPSVASSTSPENQWSATVDSNGKIAFTATSAAADTAKVQYSLDTATYATTVTAAANQAVGITLAKPATGKHTLYVRAVDKAGNASAGKAYVFYFGSGIALAQPVENHVTARRIPLQLQIDSSQVSALGAHSYQYRRGATDTWKPVPLADVTNTAGTTLTAWPATAAPTTAVSYWDAAKTLGGGGVIDVRATFAGNGSSTDPNTVTVDINAGQAGTAQAGPGEVNLLTGEYSLAEDDVTLFGASIGRTYGSRSSTAGQDNGQSGAFGPQWDLSGASGYIDTSWKSVRKTSAVSVELEDADGIVFAFTAAAGGGWAPQPGAEDLKLTGSLTGTFTLVDTDANRTTFAKPSGGTAPPADIWPASSAAPAGIGGTVRYGFSVDANGKLRLARIAAPNPALSDTALQTCADPSTDLLTAARRGCRTLELIWSTPAGGFTGQRVTVIKSYAWDPSSNGSTGAMTARTETTYGYDDAGRLTSVTDPRPAATPNGQALTTTYSYDTNTGLLTGLIPPGQKPFQFVYATGSTTAGPAWDRSLPTSAGRLVTVSRPTLEPGTTDTVNGAARTNVVYGVPVTTASGGPADLNLGTTSQWGQSVAPFDGTAVFDTDAAAQPSGDHWANDDTTARSWARSDITYLDVNGREVNTRARNGLLDATVYDRNGNTIFELDGGNRALALGQGSDATATLAELGLDGLSSDARAANLATITTFETGTSGADRVKLVQGPVRTVVTASGAQEQQRPTQRFSYDVGRPSSAIISDLATSTATGGVSIDSDPGTASLDNSRSTSTTYDWTLGRPLDVTTDPSPASGDEVVNRTRYDDKGCAVKQQQPSDTDGTTAGTRVTTYWGESSGPCADHPEWGDLICRTSYAATISGAGSTNGAELPTTTTTYNRAGKAASITETANGTTRTSSTSFDAADRPVESTTTGPALGATQAARTMAYAPDTGQLRTLTADGKTITTVADSLGRQLSYTDATGLRGTTRYDTMDRAVATTESDTAAGGLNRSFTRAASYDSDTGRVTSIGDTQAGAIAVTYDTAGNIASQTHTAAAAGGLRATSRYSVTGAEIERVWTLTNLAEPVLSEAVVQNIHGQQVDHTQMPGGHRTYTYDGTGRLTSTVELDANECTVRAYRFDQNSNRTGRSAATSDAGLDNNGDAVVCPTPTTPSVDASYDTGDRLTSTGYVYDAFGRTTRMPDVDGRVMRLGFHVNDLIATQTLFANATDADANNGAGQNPLQRSTYNLDATGERFASRTLATNNADTGVTDTVVRTLRYASAADSPTWTDEGDGTLTRNISGASGELTATASISKSGNADDTLTWQISSIHGDIAATLPANDTEPLQLSRPDEFGANTSDAPRYGWLGASQRAGDTPGGLILMGVRLYNPNTGRFLTADPIYGGNATSYGYPTDPVNAYDTDGRCGTFGNPFKSCGLWRVDEQWTDKYGRRIPLRHGRDSRGKIDGVQYGKFGSLHVKAGHVDFWSGGPGTDKWATTAGMHHDVSRAIQRGTRRLDPSGNPNVRMYVWHARLSCGCKYSVVVFVDFRRAGQGHSGIVGITTAYKVSNKWV